MKKITFLFLILFLFTIVKAQDVPQKAVAEVVNEIGPIPEEALYLGSAFDELPVMLNVEDPVVGSLVVTGPSGIDFNMITKAYKEFGSSLSANRDLKFGLITNEDFSNGAGADKIKKVSNWIDAKTDRTASVIFIEEFNNALKQNPETLQYLRNILQIGHKKNVRIIANTTGLSDNEWLKLFHVKITQLGERLFEMPEGDSKLQFWTPTL